MNFCFYIETLSVESNCVILSAAIIWFDPADASVTYEDLVDRALYVKFEALDQKNRGRVVDPNTVEWWKKQGESIQKLCLYPSKKDIHPIDGINKIKDYIKIHGNPSSFFWARGNLDSKAIDSLCDTYKQEMITSYNSWMDVRTAIRLTKETSDWNGYCKVPDLDLSMIGKHNPIDDVALDILMLTRGL